MVNSLEVLLSHYQLDQSEVEKDLVRVIFDKALQDPNNLNFYAQLPAIGGESNRLDNQFHPSTVPARRR